MERMKEISKALGKLFITRAKFENELEIIERELADQTIAIAPADGWPGKNETERALAKERTCKSDQIYHDLLTRYYSVKGAFRLACAKIDALEAERRGLEWVARLEMSEENVDYS